MTRGIMNSTVSMCQAIGILSACLVFSVMISLMPHNSGSNTGASDGRSLRSASGQAQQQYESPYGGPGPLRPKKADMSLFSGSAWPIFSGSAWPTRNSEEEKVNDRVLADEEGERNYDVWDGYLPSVKNRALDELDLSMETPYSFEFSYDYRL